MELYQEIILDHFKHPRNKGELGTSQRVLSCSESNVGCGDEIQVKIVLDELQSKIEDIKWLGQGCAISTASMSLLSEFVIGKTVEEVKLINEETMLEMLGLEEITPAREKCMMLSVRAVNRALQE
jgi:nitrogen fixation NifU-like protein